MADCTWDDIILLKEFHEELSLGSFLVKCLFKENDAREVGESTGRGQEELAKG